MGQLEIVSYKNVSCTAINIGKYEPFTWLSDPVSVYGQLHNKSMWMIVTLVPI